MNKEKLVWPITIILIFIFFLIFVYFIQTKKSSKEEDNFIQYSQNVENRKEDDYFLKKIECEKYREKIEQKIAEYNNLQVPEIRDSNNSGGEPIYNLYVENEELKDLFYSPKLNSCVYLKSLKTLVKRGADANPNIGSWSISYDTYYLIDILSNKEIDFNNGLPFIQIIHRGEVFNTEENLEEVLLDFR